MEDKYLEYLQKFKKRREFIESEWNELMNKKTSSSFDNRAFFTDDGAYWCFNAKKYTLLQAVEIVRPSIIEQTEDEYGEFCHVAKSFIRHRAGYGEDGPCTGWAFGDEEFGYHAVPVWMFTWDDEYDAVEDALKKEDDNGR